MAARGHPRAVAVIGGGDGGALREVLRYRTVERATVADLDPRVTAVTRAFLTDVPGGAFDDPRATLLTMDGWRFLREVPAGSLDVVVVDLPDPTFDAVALLYTREFYATVRDALAPGGVLVTQAGSSFETPHVTASIARTVASVFGHADVHESMVWSFGTWAFVPARKDAPPPSATPDADVAAAFTLMDAPPRWYRPSTFRALFDLGRDPAVEDAAGSARVSTVERPLTMNPWHQSARAPPSSPGWLVFAIPALALAGAGALVLRHRPKEVSDPAP